MSRHHAQALAHLLEGGLSRAEAAWRTRPLADLAKTLQSSAAPRPRPQFKAGLRAKLLTQARAMPVPPPLLLARLRGAVDQT
ncbi:MAG: hypothetical protein M3276_04455, partial [Actinomycetota bacterium]|nr:hypothetical protein [Actinomycetota bacterium]